MAPSTTSSESSVKAPTQPRYTIDELARVAETTSRNIRAYQSRGLLPHPELVGRTGYYGEDHLAHLRMIMSLQERGFSLAGIRAVLDTWKEGGGLEDLLGFEMAITLPWESEPPEELSKADLEKQLPGITKDEKALKTAIKANLIVPDGKQYLVPDPLVLESCSQFIEIGVPVRTTVEPFEELMTITGDVANRLIGVFLESIWKPLAETDNPAERLPELTQIVTQISQASGKGLIALMKNAMRQRIGNVVGQQAGIIQAEHLDKQ